MRTGHWMGRWESHLGLDDKVAGDKGGQPEWNELKK